MGNMLREQAPKTDDTMIQLMGATLFGTSYDVRFVDENNRGISQQSVGGQELGMILIEADQQEV